MGEIDLNSKIRKFLNSALNNINARDYSKALNELMKAEGIDNKNPEILYNIGICFCKLENFDDAIIYFKKVLDLPFKFVDLITVNKLLSYCLIKQNQLMPAIEYIDKILTFVPADTSLLNMLGYCYEKQKRYNEALSVYRKIIDIDKNNFNAYNSLSYILALINSNLDEALGYAKKSLQADRENPAYLDTIGYVYTKKGNAEQAKKYLKMALSKLPESEEIKRHLRELLRI